MARRDRGRRHPSHGYNDKDDPRVSVGANYYGFDPLFAFSYMPKSGWETPL